MTQESSIPACEPTQAGGAACPAFLKLAVLETRVSDLEDGQSREESFRKTYYADREARIQRDAQLDGMLSGMAVKLDGVKAWVDEQQARPARRWDGVVTKLVEIFIAALAGFLLARLGLQ